MKFELLKEWLLAKNNCLVSLFFSFFLFKISMHNFETMIQSYQSIIYKKLNPPLQKINKSGDGLNMHYKLSGKNLQ